MAPGILYICCMLFHNWFMDLWPGKKRVGTRDIMLDDDGEIMEEQQEYTTPAPQPVMAMETKGEDTEGSRVIEPFGKAATPERGGLGKTPVPSGTE
jgi:hypothetical protein